MTKRFSFWFLTGGLLAGLAGALAHETRQLLRLQMDVAAARVVVAHGPSVQAENERLRRSQVSAEELTRLRADHAAIPRLRAELHTLGSIGRAPESTVPR